MTSNSKVSYSLELLIGSRLHKTIFL